MDHVDNLRADRGSLPTVPESAKLRAADEERPSIPLERPRLTWAVDLGDSDVRAMSTFDLWRALSTGELSPCVPVWRVGRECWSPAIEVPELACALRVSLHEVPVRPDDDAPRITVDYITAPPAFGLADGGDDAIDGAKQEEPRLRSSLPEMVFTAAELQDIEAAAARLQESPSSELPQAVVLPPRSSNIELDAERATVLPTPSRGRRQHWIAAAAAAAVAALLLPAIASDASPSGAARGALDARVVVAAHRTADVLEHGPQAQARIEGSMTKITPSPRPEKKPLSSTKKGQKRRSRTSAR